MFCLFLGPLRPLDGWAPPSPRGHSWPAEAPGAGQGDWDGWGFLPPHRGSHSRECGEIFPSKVSCFVFWILDFQIILFSSDLVTKLEGVRTAVTCFEGFLADALAYEIGDIIAMLKSFDKEFHTECRGLICKHVYTYFVDVHAKVCIPLLFSGFCFLIMFFQFDLLQFEESGLRQI